MHHREWKKSKDIIAPTFVAEKVYLEQICFALAIRCFSSLLLFGSGNIFRICSSDVLFESIYYIYFSGVNKGSLSIEFMSGESIHLKTSARRL